MSESEHFALRRRVKNKPLAKQTIDNRLAGRAAKGENLVSRSKQKTRICVRVFFVFSLLKRDSRGEL